MLDQIDFSAPHRDKEEVKRERDDLTSELVLLQQRAVKAKVPLVVVFEGWESSGKGSRINEIATNLDARATEVHVIEEPIGYESRLPFMARFWSRLGARGHITIFDQSWYNTVFNILMKSYAKSDKRGRSGDADAVKAISLYLDSIDKFERQLHDDGYVIIKFFLHISKKEQRKRMKELLANPDTAWRVGEADRLQQENYEHYSTVMDALLTTTDKPYARWYVLNAENRQETRCDILRAIVGAWEPMVAAAENRAEKEAAKVDNQLSTEIPEAFTGYSEEDLEIADSFNEEMTTSHEEEIAVIETAGVRSEHWTGPVGGASAADLTSNFQLVKVPLLDEIDHTLSMPVDEYRKRLKAVQARLSSQHQRVYRAGIPVMIAYEGWDAAGKGGNIKRLAQALDARGYQIYPSPAPTPNELAHPHLWRYWTRLPRTGHIGIYDRTWYGRVLVERVEGITPPERWRQGYDEINEFEEDMRRAGVLLLKFWIDVSPEVQLQRFKDREANPNKQWKIVPDDWRNRGKNPLYYVAINDMLRLTSTKYAPWHIIESDDKRYARIKALEIVADTIDRRLGQNH